MPTYQYRCENCEHTLQLFQSMSDEPARHCPACERDMLVRVITGGAGIIFKGSGFYVNDSKRSAQRPSSTQQKDGDSTAEATPDSSKEASGTKETNTASAPANNNDKSSSSADSQSTAPATADTDTRRTK